MELVFRALANQNRRKLLDSLYECDGQTLNELCKNVRFSRQAVSKHLQVLIDADLILIHWEGRKKLHYLNAVPIHDINERWIRKYARRRLSAISALKHALEDESDE